MIRDTLKVLERLSLTQSLYGSDTRSTSRHTRALQSPLIKEGEENKSLQAINLAIDKNFLGNLVKIFIL